MSGKRGLSVVPPSAPPKKDLSAAGRVRHYRQRLVERGLAPSTVRLYTTEVERAEWWCERSGHTLRNVPGLVLGEYVAARPKSWATRKAMLSSIKLYWTIFKRKDSPLWVLKVPRKPRMVCRALTEDEAQRLAAVARSCGDRGGLAVQLAMYQGLRREEICSVRWRDITSEGWINVIGKGDLPATLPLHPVVKEALDQLDRECGAVWVFPGRVGGHASPATIWTWGKHLAAEAGLEHVSLHRLRHTCLATANDITGDLRGTATFARHARVDTTQGYTRTTERRLRAVVNAVNYEPGEIDAATELGGLLDQRRGWRYEEQGPGSFRVWREAASPS